MKKCENYDNWCEHENLIKENEKLKNNDKKEVDNIGMNYD